MKFSGYLDGEKVTFCLDGMARLILIHADGSEEPYNEEYYDEDQYTTIRTMLIRDGITQLTDEE